MLNPSWVTRARANYAAAKKYAEDGVVVAALALAIANDKDAPPEMAPFKVGGAQEVVADGEVGDRTKAVLALTETLLRAA